MNEHKVIQRILAELNRRPKDPRLLQRAGEHFQRSGDIKLAALYFTRLAARLADDGFLLQATAVTKQVLKLDPSLLATRAFLASLYERNGLIAEAVAEYERLLSHYRSLGPAEELGQILEALARLGGRASPASKA